MNRTPEHKLEITEYLIPGAEGGLAQQLLHPCELKFLHKLSCVKEGQIEATSNKRSTPAPASENSALH